MKLLADEELESRTYQEVIAASASNLNTLVVLPTGLGKTVIGAMVAAMKGEDGKVLFLAPTKPLAQQHRRTFNNLLTVPEVDLTLLTGDVRPDERTDLWTQKRFFFATPQVVENDIIDGKVPVEELSLVIFDEAHRATGSYSYNFISEQTPQVQKLALTASPGGSREKIEEVADNLEIDNFELRTEDDPDVEPYVQDRELEWRRVELDGRFQEAKKKLGAARRDFLKQLKELGQLNSVSNVYKTDLLKIRSRISSELSSSDDPELYEAISLVATAIKVSQAQERLETQGVTQCYRYTRKLKQDDSKAAARAQQNEDFQEAKSLVEYLKKEGEEHPKLEELRGILGDMEKNEKAIVFTEYRDSVDTITSALQDEGLSPVKFIGQSGDDGMTQKKQKEVLDAFEEDHYDVLVSTSIGEEGLDIPAVDHVVFYEPVASEIRDIQRAGRTGRQESGNVVVLMAEGTRDEGNYWSAKRKKEKMKETIKDLKREHGDAPEKTLDSFGDDDQTSLADVPSTTDDLEASEQQKEGSASAEGAVVVADDRENDVNRELARLDIEVDRQRLETADFVVSDRVAVERKEAADFADSVIDGRLFDQLSELSEYQRAVVILEGENLYGHRGISSEAIRGALVSAVVDYGVSVLRSSGVEDTARTLRRTAEREQKEEDRDVEVRSVDGSRNAQEQLLFVAAGLPGVNTKLAERLMEQFGTLEHLFSADKTELKEIEGIGEGKAEKIRTVVSRKYTK
nr:MAG: ERCC4-like helicase [Candidatus Nanosalinarum sp. J07AB56]